MNTRLRHVLALLLPVILWLARWLAAGEQRSSLSEADVARAIAIADHRHGYSPLFGTPGFRWRVRLLAQRDDIARLVLDKQFGLLEMRPTAMNIEDLYLKIVSGGGPQ